MRRLEKQAGAGPQDSAGSCSRFGYPLNNVDSELDC